VVLTVSLIAGFLIHQKARNELYESREQLARGLSENVTQRLSDQLLEVRDELMSWGRFLAGSTARALPGENEQDRFQNWLRGLGDLATSRYDILAVVDKDLKIVAINSTALSVQRARPPLSSWIRRAVREAFGYRAPHFPLADHYANVVPA
jgi:hypothetical protein